MNYFANTVLSRCLQKYYVWKKLEMVINCLFAYLRAMAFSVLHKSNGTSND